MTRNERSRCAETGVHDGRHTQNATGYLDFEIKLLDCADKVGFAMDGIATATTIVGSDVILRTARESHLDVGPTPPASMGELLRSLQRVASSLDAEEASLVRRMQDNDIGLYTVEQEADEIALDVATKLGFSVDEILEARLAGMDAWDAMLGQALGSEDAVRQWRSEHQALSGKECRALVQAGFTEEKTPGQKTPVMVKLGDLDDPHHSSCYRVFNLWREANTHRYVVGPAQPPLMPAWNDLRAAAARASAEPQKCEPNKILVTGGPPWQPPAKVADACSLAQIQAMAMCATEPAAMAPDGRSCLTYLADPANANCSVCAFSRSARGPLLPPLDSSGWRLNVGGCTELANGGDSPTGCGARVLMAQACTEQACSSCVARGTLVKGVAVAMEACRTAAAATVCSDLDASCAAPHLAAGGACYHGDGSAESAFRYIRLFCGPSIP